MTMKIVAWTISVKWNDGTEEDIADMPKDVSTVVDQFLTEVENGKNESEDA